MSIGTDVARIKGNITAALAAIADKGVTVPAGSTSDALAGLIASIEAGVGGNSDNIVFGSFTPSEDLSASNQIYIDVTFPKDEFPLMYCVIEDMRSFQDNDTSHTLSRVRCVMGSLVKDRINYITYFVYSVYNSKGSSTISFSNSVNSRSGSKTGFLTVSAGMHGSMDVSLADRQVKFGPYNFTGCYLQGRTYYYILLWGD